MHSLSMAINSILSQAPLLFQSRVSEGGSWMSVNAVDSINTIATVQATHVLAVDVSKWIYTAQRCNGVHTSNAIYATVSTDSDATDAICNSISYAVHTVNPI